MKRWLLGVVSMVFCIGLANASIIVDFTGITPSGPNSVYNYTAAVAPDEEVDPSLNTTFFTIYDFSGFLSVVGAPANWGFTPSLSGPFPPGTSQPDNPAILNITFFYTGPTIPGAFTFSGFQILDSSNQTQQGAYAAEATKDSGDQTGSEDSNVGFTTVPAVSPEPASLMLIGGGLIALAFARKRLMR